MQIKSTNLVYFIIFALSHPKGGLMNTMVCLKVSLAG